MVKRMVGAAGIALALAAVALPGAEAEQRAGRSIDEERARATVEYWTPEKMRQATPMDTLTVDKARLLENRKLNGIAEGAPRVVPPTPKPGAAPRAAATPRVFPQFGGVWDGGGAVVPTSGRVFFTYQGRNASCSGAAVTSANKSTVITAGHCVKLDGAYHANFVFVPAYDNGKSPHGTWPARKTMVTPQWDTGEDFDYDVGAAVVHQVDGKSLTDVVGGQGIAFNQPREQDVYAFGYPAAKPYDGTRLVYCGGPTFGAFLSEGLGMNCDMTPGASGGPWYRTFDEGAGTGAVNSVNSYKINFFPMWTFGPYFGDDAQRLYDAAQGG